MLSSSVTLPRPQVISRLFSEELFNRTAMLDELRRAIAAEAIRTTLVLGPPHAGKTELLRTSFDRLFHELGRALPIYYSLRRDRLTPDKFAYDWLLTLLRHYLAFAHDDPDLISRYELTPRELINLARAEEYAIIKEVLDGYEARVSRVQPQALVRYVLGAPQLMAARSPYRLVVMLDEAQWLDQVLPGEGCHLLAEMIQPPSAVCFTITGLQRALLGQLSLEEGLLETLKILRLTPLDLPSLQTLVERWCHRLGVASEQETLRLAIEQLDGDLFYLRSLVAAASDRRLGLTHGPEFEQLYIEELLQGRIAHYFSGLIRRIAQDVTAGLQSERMAIEIVYLCAEASASRPPIEFIEGKFEVLMSAPQLLSELHNYELITLLDGHVLPSEDRTFCEWIEATHRRFEGEKLSEVKFDLLRRRVKAMPRLLALSSRRTLHARIEAMLKRFDGQSIARSLLAHDEFLIRYGRASYQLILAGLKAEIDRIKLPQIIYVTESPLLATDPEQGTAIWSCLLGYGFEEGIYDNEHEVVWVLAVADSPAAVTVEAVTALDEKLETLRDPLSSGKAAPRVVRWAISKMGFSLDAVAALDERGFATSDYLQLELLAECLDTAPAAEAQLPEERERTPSPLLRAFDLAIPINEDKEIIAARVIEQIAKSIGFSPEEVNQLKTAMIEACLSLMGAGQSPDGRIHQRYRATDQQMTIIIADSAAGLDETGGVLIDEDPERIWRVEVLRSLVDQVRLSRLEHGWRVELTKFKKQGAA